MIQAIALAVRMRAIRRSRRQERRLGGGRIAEFVMEGCKLPVDDVIYASVANAEPDRGLRLALFDGRALP